MPALVVLASVLLVAAAFDKELRRAQRSIPPNCRPDPLRPSFPACWLGVTGRFGVADRLDGFNVAPPPPPLPADAADVDAEVRLSWRQPKDRLVLSLCCCGCCGIDNGCCGGSAGLRAASNDGSGAETGTETGRGIDIGP